MRLQGWKDSNLTRQGIKDCKDLSEYMKNIHIDQVYSSPLNRAVQTTNLIFKQDYIVDDRLKEMNFGDYEGKLIPFLKENKKDYYDLWNNPTDNSRLPGGESYKEVKARLNDFIKDVYKQHSNDSIFITIHGMLFNVLMLIVKDIPTERLVEINNTVVKGCSLTEVNYDGKEFDIVRLGDDSFLKNKTKENSYK